jgi:hypothetical protein
VSALGGRRIRIIGNVKKAGRRSDEEGLVVWKCLIINSLEQFGDTGQLQED